MKLDREQIIKLIIGGAIGALLGAGTAWLLMQAPDGPEEGAEPKPISAGEVITLTAAAAALIRRIDDFRRKM